MKVYVRIKLMYKSVKLWNRNCLCVISDFKKKFKCNIDAESLNMFVTQYLFTFVQVMYKHKQYLYKYTKCDRLKY